MLKNLLVRVPMGVPAWDNQEIAAVFKALLKGFRNSDELVKKLVGVEQMEEWGIYGNSFFYWTRSPESRYDSLVCEISPGGGLEYFPASGQSGVLPALNLKAGILVSEIRN